MQSECRTVYFNLADSFIREKFNNKWGREYTELTFTKNEAIAIMKLIEDTGYVNKEWFPKKLKEKEEGPSWAPKWARELL